MSDIFNRRNQSDDAKTNEDGKHPIYQRMFQRITSDTMNVFKTFVFLLCFSLSISVIVTTRNENEGTRQFSNHTFENQNHHSITGPFLSNVRFRPNTTERHEKDSLRYNFTQSACNFNHVIVYLNDPKHNQTRDTIEEKCKIMRIPTLYLGDVYSSWSVLEETHMFYLISKDSWLNIYWE